MVDVFCVEFGCICGLFCCGTLVSTLVIGGGILLRSVFVLLLRILIALICCFKVKFVVFGSCVVVFIGGGTLFIGGGLLVIGGGGGVGILLVDGSDD